MEYQIEENCMTVFLPREVDHHSAEKIRKESDTLISKKHIRYIIFDFQETDFMDSSGIGMLMGRYRQIHLLGGEIWAVNMSPRMKRMLQMSGITKIMHIMEEMES